MKKAVCILVLAVGGCAHYVPVNEGVLVLERGTPIRARFLERETVRLGDLTAHNITTLEGELVRIDPAQMVVSALWVESGDRTGGLAGNGWTVRIDRRNLSSVEQKRFDWWRTAALVSGALLASYLGWQSADGLMGGGDTGSGNGGAKH